MNLKAFRQKPETNKITNIDKHNSHVCRAHQQEIILEAAILNLPAKTDPLPINKDSKII